MTKPNIQTILAVVACICFFLAAIGVPRDSQTPSRYSIGWLGAFFLTLALLFS